jgi:hypothetical protein
MTDLNRLVFTIAPDAVSGSSANVRLETFIEGLDNVRRALTRFDRITTEQARPTTTYEVVALSPLNSPATVTLEPRPVNSAVDTRVQVVSGFMRGAQMLEEGGNVLPSFDRPMLEILKETAEQARRQGVHLSLRSGPYHVDFDIRLEHRIDHLLEQEEGVFGSIEGVLERVNFHAGANVYTVFPFYGPERINCRFEPHLRDAVNDAILQHVRVTGMVWSDKRTGLPHRADMEEIEPLVDVTGRPSLSELRGIAPGLTGGLTVSEFLRGTRDGWA